MVGDMAWLEDVAPTLSAGTSAVSADCLAKVEGRLGFGYPDVVRLAYLQLGCGLSTHRLVPPEHAAADYLRDRAEKYAHWEWPERLVTVCDWGCGIRACALMTSSDPEIWWFDPNLEGEGPGGGHVPPWRTGSTFTEWIVRWARRDLFADYWDLRPR